jgi:replicative DNA helicase
MSKVDDFAEKAAELARKRVYDIVEGRRRPKQPEWSDSHRQQFIEAMSACIDDNSLLGFIIVRGGFSDRRHQLVYAAIGKLMANGVPVDEVTIGELLEERDVLDEVGGYAFLAELVLKAPRCVSS